MPVPLRVDSLHLTAENLAVHGGVAEVVNGNEIVNHLMEDGVLDEGFRQVETSVDTEGKIRINPVAEEPFSMLDEGHFAQESAGIRELDRDRRKGAGEEAGVVLVEALLNIFFGRNQGNLIFDVGDWRY